MGGLKKTRSTGGSTTPNSTIGGYTESNKPAGTVLSSGGFPDDGSRRMPSSNDPVAAENARKLRNALSARSGRASTDLTGTRAYVNTFLGGTR